MGKKIEWKDGRTVGKLAGSSLTLREGVEASFASNNYTTDVESLASHYTNVVTRFKTLVSMYPRVESTSLPRADNGITSFANIPVRPLSSLLQVLMHEGQSNQRGPCLPNACTSASYSQSAAFQFSHIFKIFLFLNHRRNETNLQILLKKKKKLFYTKYIHHKYSCKFFNCSNLCNFFIETPVEKSLQSLIQRTLTNLDPIKRRIDGANRR